MFAIDIKEETFMDVEELNGEVKGLVNYIQEKTPFKLDMVVMNGYVNLTIRKNELRLNIDHTEDWKVKRLSLIELEKPINGWQYKTQFYETVDEFKEFYDEYSKILDELNDLMSNYINL